MFLLLVAGMINSSGNIDPELVVNLEKDMLLGSAWLGNGWQRSLKPAGVHF
jgi:hypothetical protein